MDWFDVPETTVKYAMAALPVAEQFRKAAVALPRVRHHALYNPATEELHVGLGAETTNEAACQWEDGLKAAGFSNVSGSPLDVPPRGYGKEPWVWIKQAADPIVSTAAKLLNYQPSALNAIFGGPSPLAAALASGLAGAGLGYVGGTVAEQFLPVADFEPGTLRRNAALAGGAIGTLPALLWGISSHQANPDTPGWRAWLSSWPFRRKDLREPLQKAQATARGAVSAPGVLEKASFQAAIPGLNQPYGHGIGQLGDMPNISRDTFGRTVWQDPNTPMPIRAATVGLVNTASMANNNSPFVSPWDIASVTATGAARGLIVGKTLGAMAGLRPESQQNLMRMGVWGNLLTTVVPNAFPAATQVFGQYLG